VEKSRNPTNSGKTMFKAEALIRLVSLLYISKILIRNNFECPSFMDDIERVTSADFVPTDCEDFVKTFFFIQVLRVGISFSQLIFSERGLEPSALKSFTSS
jgi:hypothetical protein